MTYYLDKRPIHLIHLRPTAEHRRAARKLGIRISGDKKVGVWYGVKLPADVIAYMGNVDAAVNANHTAIRLWFDTKYGRIVRPNQFDTYVTPPSEEDKMFLSSWGSFRDSWKKLFSDYSESGTLYQWLGSNSLAAYQEVEKYDIQNKEWSKKLVERGGVVVAPAIPSPKDVDKTYAQSGIPWTPILIIGGLGVAAVYLGPLLSQYTKK